MFAKLLTHRDDSAWVTSKTTICAHNESMNPRHVSWLHCDMFQRRQCCSRRPASCFSNSVSELFWHSVDCRHTNSTLGNSEHL